MGSSSRPRKNPLVAQGLRAGVLLKLEVSLGDRVELLATTVEDVNDDALVVAAPMRERVFRLLPTGTSVRASYLHGIRPRGFVTQVAGTVPGGHAQRLALPLSIESLDKRRAYRLPTVLEPVQVYRLKVDPDREEREPITTRCTIVDLSEGGLCLSTRAHLEHGEWLGVVTDLPGYGHFQARMRVVGIDNRNAVRQRVHCQFVGVDQASRDAIARSLLRLQLEMRRRGQL